MPGTTGICFYIIDQIDYRLPESWDFLLLIISAEHSHAFNSNIGHVPGVEENCTYQWVRDKRRLAEMTRRLCYASVHWCQRKRSHQESLTPHLSNRWKGIWCRLTSQNSDHSAEGIWSITSLPRLWLGTPSPTWVPTPSKFYTSFQKTRGWGRNRVYFSAIQACKTL